jgi:hypothetical protein
MADPFDREEHEGGGGFMMGLLTGTVLGAGLGMLLAPKSGSELRTQLGEQATSLGRRAGGAASGLVERVRETAGRASDQMRGRAHAAGDAPGGGRAAGPRVIDMPLGEAVRSSDGPLPSERVASGSTYTGNAGGLDRDRS